MDKFIDKKLNMGATVNPFKVPKGYFEHLSERVMDRIQEENTPVVMTVGDESHNTTHTHIVTLRSFRWAAAVACLAVMATVTVHFFGNTKVDESIAVTLDLQNGEELIEATDYAMLNNQDVYDIFVEENL